MLVIIFSLFLIFVLYVLNFFLSLKDFYIQKLNSFECGFLSLGKIQNSFSIHFFIIMLMFVIFDLEIIMFFGLFISNLLLLFGLVFMFLFMLGGLYLEWYFGKLSWII